MNTSAPLHRLRESDVKYCENRDNGGDAGLLSAFTRDTDNHVMHVLHDVGLNRHLHFRPAEGARFHWFDLITWTGGLTITGDMGTYTFRRIDDMFEFFTRRVNSSYWAEKLQNGTTGGGDEVRKHDADTFKLWLLQTFWHWSRDHEDTSEVTAAWQSIREAILDTYAFLNMESRDDCITALQEHSGPAADHYTDCWEADWTKYDYHFEWCLAAILTGIRTYKEWKVAA
ncbi:hypothetical protein [Nesterenkonia rhizosphaerae]|uniref:Uncharacterized protein n=1 Tax=Nesterenkonia rhizosphaerae TaxID=1348272 RepID=A0ABP9G0A9_9MICC